MLLCLFYIIILSWLKFFIDFNIKLRLVVKLDFDKDCFKMKNNLVFRKMMLNICIVVDDVRLVNNWKKVEKFISKV